MSRRWPGGTAEGLIIPTSSIWNFNTNVCLLVRLRTPASFAGSSKTLVQCGVNGNRGFELDVGNSGYLVFVKVAVAVINGTGTTTMAANDIPYAVLAFSTTGGNGTFKIYNLNTSTLTSETITNTGTMNAPSTDGGVIGNVGPSLGTTSSWNRDIDRVLIGQGTLPSDAAFIAWARAATRPPTLTVKGEWVLSPSGVATSPEVDTSGNGLNITTITGTTASAAIPLPDAVPTMRIAPTIPPFLRRGPLQTRGF